MSSYREDDEVKWVGTRPAHHGTPVCIVDSCENTTKTVYTVATGYRAFLWYFSTSCDNVTGTRDIFVYDNNNVLKLRLYNRYSVASVSLQGECVSLSHPIILDAGWYIKISASGANAGIFASFYLTVEPV